MGVELLKIGIKVRKGVMLTIRSCFKSVRNHPFLVLLLSVLIYMYRSSPFMFSYLVSASPILVCTAVLLGTLLFFGQPNIPEIEIEERIAHEATPLKTELSKDSVSVEKNVDKNESYFVERFSEKRKDEGERLCVGSSLSESKPDEICREGSVDVTAPSNKERSGEDESEKGEILEGRRKLDDEKIEKPKTEWNDERLSDGEAIENQYASIPKASDIESEYEKSEADSFDSERVNMDSLESSAWKEVEQREEEEGEEQDDGLDSGSDGAESSSPDASEADIMPMLDELHPLLDEDVAQPIQISRVGSNAPSEQYSRLSTSSIESVDETENQEDSEVADDEIDNEDGEEEDDDDDDVQGNKEDRAKVAIKWTEEDQKNLMDLGCSEIERNQRLENLIMRRRTRQITSMVPEINLIDLESSDFPNVAPINTNRQNPFDLPHDSYDNIPGSAPSVLLPRRNPFDIPYDSTEEKPDQTGDRFEEEVKTSQSRDPFFRRRDSFNVGPSVFAPSRHDLKWKPYFIPERMVLEESSYSTLQRQSSEMSDSKASSVSETESVSSVEDLENRKLEEEEDPQEVIEEDPLGGQDQVSTGGFSEEDEPEVISETNHVGHGSQSSEGEECLELGSVEKREIEFMDRVEDQYGGGHHKSSLSEVTERVSTVTNDQDLSMSDNRNNGVSLGPNTSKQTSKVSINSTLVDDVPRKEPVYDSSPSDENFVDQRTQGDKNIEQLGEDEHPERGSPTPVDGGPQVENSIEKGETLQSPDSDTDYHEANEKISTPSTGRSTSHFYDSGMHEPDFEHLQEVQVPNTPVESSEKLRSIHNINIPGLHVLDRVLSPSIKSSLTTDSVSEEAVSHVDTQTILEEAADEIEENHAGKLSELDCAETSTSTTDLEVKSFEEAKVQQETRSDRRNGTVNDVREAHSDIERGNSSESSSSSDSEENKKAMWAKRRLSTPF